MNEKDFQQEEKQIENVPVYEVAPVNSGEIVSFDDFNLKQLEERIEKINRIKQLALKVTNETDWVNQNGKPYLMASGVKKVARLFGISLNVREIIKERDADEEGEYITYTALVEARYKNSVVEDIGTASTRDSFFGVISYYNKETKEKIRTFKPLSEIDLTSVKKKAITNGYNRAISGLLGLSFTWDDLKEAGLDISKITTIEYKSKKNSTQTKQTKAVNSITAKQKVFIKRLLESHHIPTEVKELVMKNLDNYTQDEASDKIDQLQKMIEQGRKAEAQPKTEPQPIEIPDDSIPPEDNEIPEDDNQTELL